MKKIIFATLMICLVVSLAACDKLPASLKSKVEQATAVPTQAPPTPTFAPLPTYTTTPFPTRTPEPQDPLKETVQAYFAALEAKDSTKAAALLSSYSLMVSKITRSEAASQLQARFARGDGWSGLEVQENRPLDDTTTLVHVVYQLETKDDKTGETSKAAKDEWWPLRNENSQWYYNLDNLINFRTLEVSAQTTGGLTIKPRQLTWYSDQIRLTMLAQNQTNDSIVLGQKNEVLASFVFAGQKVEAEQAQFIFNRLRSYPEIELVVKGNFDAFPDGVVIRQWKNVKTAPWYTFDFNQ